MNKQSTNTALIAAGTKTVQRLGSLVLTTYTVIGKDGVVHKTTRGRIERPISVVDETGRAHLVDIDVPIWVQKPINSMHRMVAR